MKGPVQTITETDETGVLTREGFGIMRCYKKIDDALERFEYLSKNSTDDIELYEIIEEKELLKCIKRKHGTNYEQLLTMKETISSVIDDDRTLL